MQKFFAKLILWTRWKVCDNTEGGFAPIIGKVFAQSLGMIIKMMILSQKQFLWKHSYGCSFGNPAQIFSDFQQKFLRFWPKQFQQGFQNCFHRKVLIGNFMWENHHFVYHSRSLTKKFYDFWGKTSFSVVTNLSTCPEYQFGQKLLQIVKYNFFFNSSKKLTPLAGLPKMHFLCPDERDLDFKTFFQKVNIFNRRKNKKFQSIEKTVFSLI